MKAVRVHGYGEKPVLESVPDPVVRDPLDVLVEIEAAGVCRTDLHIIEGQWADKSGVALPYTIGHENAGVVIEVGDGVTEFQVGDRVGVCPTADGVGAPGYAFDGDEMTSSSSTVARGRSMPIAVVSWKSTSTP